VGWGGGYQSVHTQEPTKIWFIRWEFHQQRNGNKHVKCAIISKWNLGQYCDREKSETQRAEQKSTEWPWSGQQLHQKPVTDKFLRHIHPHTKQGNRNKAHDPRTDTIGICGLNRPEKRCFAGTENAGCNIRGERRPNSSHYLGTWEWNFHRLLRH